MLGRLRNRILVAFFLVLIGVLVAGQPRTILRQVTNVVFPARNAVSHPAPVVWLVRLAGIAIAGVGVYIVVWPFVQ